MGSHLLVEDAKEATLFITARTSFRSEHPLQWCMDVLSNAEKESYGTLQERHRKDYLSYYEKSNLKLNYKDSYEHLTTCLLYTSDAADEEDSVDLGGRRIN